MNEITPVLYHDEVHQYIVVSAMDAPGIVSYVNDLNKRGWRASGGVITTFACVNSGFNWYQAMVRTIPEHCVKFKQNIRLQNREYLELIADVQVFTNHGFIAQAIISKDDEEMFYQELLYYATSHDETMNASDLLTSYHRFDERWINERYGDHLRVGQKPPSRS